MSKNDEISEEDKRLFREFTHDVKPLQNKNKKVALATPPRKKIVSVNRKALPTPTEGLLLRGEAERGTLVGRSAHEGCSSASMKQDAASVAFSKRTHARLLEKSSTSFAIKGHRSADFIPPPYSIAAPVNSDEPAQAETILSYCRQKLPKKRFLDFKNGKFQIHATLDLHGLNLDNAQDRLCDFLDKHYELQHRCLLIIHGKGGRRGEAPILKNRLNDWLRQLPGVLAFHSALAKHGGSGAVYVLLKRLQLKTKT